MIIAIAQRQSALDAILALLNGGSIKFYSGARPASLTLGANSLLATCPLSSPAFGATNSSGVATASAILTDGAPPGSSSSVAAFAFACKADGTPVLNLTVGLASSGAELTLDTLTIVGATGSLAVTSLSLTFPAGT